MRWQERAHQRRLLRAPLSQSQNMLHHAPAVSEDAQAREPHAQPAAQCLHGAELVGAHQQTQHLCPRGVHAQDENRKFTRSESLLKTITKMVNMLNDNNYKQVISNKKQEQKFTLG